MKKIKIQSRRDTLANWESNNPVLRDGECGYITDGKYYGMYKMGDGSTNWNNLPYSGKPSVQGDVVSSAFTVTSDSENHVLLVTGTTTITLPVIEDGFVVTVKNIGNGTVTVKPSSTTIDGSSSSVELSQYEFISILQHGSAYYIYSTNQISSVALGELTIDDGVIVPE